MVELCCGVAIGYHPTVVVMIGRRGVELAREQRVDVDAVEAAAGLELGLDLWGRKTL